MKKVRFLGFVLYRQVRRRRAFECTEKSPAGHLR
jgi:hypothetical protein